VQRQAQSNDLGRRHRYRLEVIDTMIANGYTTMDAEDHRLQVAINEYYDAGIAPAGVPYYAGKYADKELLISWGADWERIQRQYFRS
jgi:hypothetical protein